MITKFKEKESLVQEIGMKFDEAVELFSDETLASMAMGNIMGGGINTNCSDPCNTQGDHISHLAIFFWHC